MMRPTDSPYQDVEEMSMFADADRFSVMIHNKMDDFAGI